MTRDQVVHAMDGNGIEKAIVQPFPGAPDAVQVHNEIAALGDSIGSRVLGLASVNPHMDHAKYQAEIRRCVDDLGFVGVKLHTLGHAVHPVSDDALVVFETAAALGIVVMVHTGPGMPFADPTHLLERARQFPDTPIVLAHAGASASPGSAIAVAKQCDNIYLEPSWCKATEVRAMINALGPDRVLFGTDTPENVRVELAKYEEIRLTEVEAAWVFGGTATAVFGLRSGVDAELPRGGA
ncbi:MAG: amidohydrolase family protein [Acidimicrobiia bacterium]|nr:amidohydrolase family protein [Acidimicrobiia bacterium]